MNQITAFGGCAVGMKLLWAGGAILALAAAPPIHAEGPWKKHVVHEGLHTSTAVAGDFTRDGKPDVISNSGGKTRLFVGPDWREVILAEGEGTILFTASFLTWMGTVISTGSAHGISRD
jgi:hypothetical protein